MTRIRGTAHSHSRLWAQMIQLEARIRMLELAQDDCRPLTVSRNAWRPNSKADIIASSQLQAGPPAFIDVCELLPLTIASFADGDLATLSPPVAILRAKHSASNPVHASTMGADDTQVFQNIVLCVSRSDSPRSRTDGTPAPQIATTYSSRWSAWEIARENDRLWREWWDNAPTTPLCSPDPSPMQSLNNAPANDSGFAELSISPGVSHLRSKSYATPHTHSLDNIGTVIKKATLELSCSPKGIDEHGQELSLQHEYRWQSIALDVFRVVVKHEERSRRSGVVTTSIMMF